MRKTYYPKTYATYHGVGSRYKKRSYAKEAIHRFLTDAGETLELVGLGRSGSTPRRLKRVWYALIDQVGYRKALVQFGIMPIGTRVKLYQRDGRWCYRHLGQ